MSTPPSVSDAAARVPVALGPDAAAHCRRRVHLRFDPDAVRPDTSHDPARQARVEALMLHREAVRQTLAANLPLVVDWTPDRTDRPAALWRPRLASPYRFGTPDLLLWVGDGYQPVIVAAHRTLDPGSGAWTATLSDPLNRHRDPARHARRRVPDPLALAHHFRLLQDLGLAAREPWGGVIGRGGPSAEPDWDDAGYIAWFDLAGPDPGGGNRSILAGYDRDFADRIAVASAAANQEPARALPSRISECRRCPWWLRCSAELRQARDVSLVAAGADVEILRSAGVHTIDELADLADARLNVLVLTAGSAVEIRARARAWRVGLPLVRRAGPVRIPRADVELDVDMESYLDDGAYLWGSYLTGEDCGLPGGYRAFATWEPLPGKDSGRILAEFWAYLQAVRDACAERGLSFAAYCYSRAAEERWLRGTPRRYPEIPGMPTPAEVAAFCDSAQWVDLFAEIKKQFVVTGSLRLKALAPLSGFAWRDPEPGGENSMAWYLAAVGGHGRAPDPVMARRVLEYNEDDVRATLALRRWLTDTAGTWPAIGQL